MQTPAPAPRARGAAEAAAGAERQPARRWPRSTRSLSRSFSAMGGAAQVPHRATGGDLRKTPGPPRHRPRGRPARQQVFTEAYADVSQAFDATFARLFPGARAAGPDRPRRHAGHRRRGRGPAARQEGQAALAAVGGERSLVAVAFLVALFKARPSPFYILDEVGRRSTTQPGSAAGDLRGLRELPAARHHPPEAHHGGRRRALRRHHARRRRPAVINGGCADAESA